MLVFRTRIIKDDGLINLQDYSGGYSNCTQVVFDDFFPGVMSYVDSTSWIEQVAWFGELSAIII